MRRRRFLSVAGAGLSTAAVGAGCLDSEPRHPFADSTVTVRVDNESNTDHDVDDNAATALGFWEEESEEYVGFGVEFDLDDHDQPDIVIEYVDTPEACSGAEEYSDRVLGCAPLIRPGIRAPQPATAYVVAGARPVGKIRITTKHEIGHILGLGHEDQPLEVMSNLPEHRIPLYDLRVEIWESVLDASRRSSDATVLFSHGVESWNTGVYEAARESFDAASSDYAEVRAAFEGARARTDEFEGHPRVETVDLEGVRGHLDTLTARMEAAEGFSSSMVAASEARLAGDDATSHLQAANQSLNEFNSLGQTELRDIAVALGLVRGFDRDEAVAPVDEDEID